MRRPKAKSSAPAKRTNSVVKSAAARHRRLRRSVRRRCAASIGSSRIGCVSLSAGAGLANGEHPISLQPRSSEDGSSRDADGQCDAVASDEHGRHRRRRRGKRANARSAASQPRRGVGPQARHAGHGAAERFRRIRLRHQWRAAIAAAVRLGRFPPLPSGAERAARGLFPLRRRARILGQGERPADRDRALFRHQGL